MAIQKKKIEMSRTGNKSRSSNVEKMTLEELEDIIKLHADTNSAMSRNV